jgi:hypothetical protein
LDGIEGGPWGGGGALWIEILLRCCCQGAGISKNLARVGGQYGEFHWRLRVVGQG